MIVAALLLSVLVLAIIAFVLFLWFFTGQHFYPESSLDYPEDDLEVVCDPALYPVYEDEEDPFSKTREIQTRNNTILNSLYLP